MSAPAVISGTKAIARVWPTLAHAAAARQCLYTSACLTATGEILSASAIVWDERCAYRILSTGVRDSRYADGLICQLMHEVDSVKSLAPAFDLTGALFRPLADIYRCFGGRLTPSYRLDRYAYRPFHLLNLTQVPSPRVTSRQFRACPVEEFQRAVLLELSDTSSQNHVQPEHRIGRQEMRTSMTMPSVSTSKDVSLVFP